MIAVFVMGYFLITIEHVIGINKATIALLMAIICWALQFANSNWLSENGMTSMTYLEEHLSNVSKVIFFLIGALTVVEIINVHKGFQVISKMIQMRSKRKLLWAVGFFTFFLSAILDNLATTIVMITLIRKLIDKGEDRLLFGGAVVIAANAGGAWTPIGDVTTTMLWIEGQLSTLNVVKELFLPSIVCMCSAFFVISFMIKGNLPKVEIDSQEKQEEPYGTLILILGVVLLVFVPIFKVTTGLPPFMGMLFALSILWIMTDILHKEYDDRNHLRVPHVLTQIDVSGTLFFLGILLCIDALDTAHVLSKLAVWLDSHLGNTNLIAIFIGLASSVVDNVPLVAASMGMYSLTQFPMDDQFWMMIAFCAGTGGSILIIGSAAGVVFMGMENANFVWYLKRVSIPAAVGYFAGIGVYLLI
jgi:Na+/H+ antiporter NhaD/arsenite permease-like protein